MLTIPFSKLFEFSNSILLFNRNKDELKTLLYVRKINDANIIISPYNNMRNLKSSIYEHSKSINSLNLVGDVTFTFIGAPLRVALQVRAEFQTSRSVQYSS